MHHIIETIKNLEFLYTRNGYDIYTDSTNYYAIGKYDNDNQWTECNNLDNLLMYIS